MDNGLLLCNSISKILIFEEIEKSKMNKDKNNGILKLKLKKDLSASICSIDCYKNYILIGDPYNLVSLYLYKQKSNKLVFLARDSR